MLAFVTNHLWQSTLYAAVIAVAAVALRRNRAAVRYWLWLSASIKFLVPFALLMSLGNRIEWTPARQFAPPPLTLTLAGLAEPFALTAPPTPSPSPIAHKTDPIPIVLAAIWSSGFVTIAVLRFRNWQRVCTHVGQASACPADYPIEVRFSPALLEPGVVGVFRPVILLPAGIVDRLTPPQLATVIAHELCHVRRRDNLFAAIHMVVEALFWFHPAVWWIGARLLFERERACDEDVLRQGSEPLAYAEGILNVAKLYVESPLACVAGISGGDLRRRIEAILTQSATPRLSALRKALLALAAIVIVSTPIVIGMCRAQSPAAPVVPAARFEVASIKPCKPGEFGGAGGKGNTKAGGGGRGVSPGRLSTPCRTVQELIHSAYISYGNDHLSRDTSAPPLEGGPDWIRSERYQVTARAEDAAGEGIMNGLLMRTLLEERLHVRTHRETKDVPVYAIAVAKGGATLPPFREGTCIPVDLGRVARPVPENQCRVMVGRRKGPNLLLEGPGVTLGDVAKLLYLVLDRPVIDRTAIPGRFDIHLEFAREETVPVFQIGGAPPEPPSEPSDEPAGPSIFAVFEKQLGLKIEKARGPRDFVVIDRVERPSEN